MNLICNDCGKIIETLPLQCSYSISMNNETAQWECFMEKCGYISINHFICEQCCTNRNIMKINEKFERLSLESKEFKHELSFFKNNTVQINLFNPNFYFWVEFGNGLYTCGKGLKQNPSILISSSQKTISEILEGTVEPMSIFLNEDFKIEGDIQYAVAFFDLIKLGLEISKEIGGEYVQ